MQSKRSTNPTWPTALISWTKRLATIVVSVVLGFTLLSIVEFDTPFVSEAYATIRAVDDEVTEEQLAADENAKSNDSESIEDEDNPMTSGLGGGEPVANDIGFGGIAIVGIVVVGAFFFVLMRKLNTSIKDMNSMIK